MSAPVPAVLVYVTASSLAEAERIAGQLVEERLVACANMVPGVRSVYRWQGGVQRADEVLLLLKTTADRSSDACRRIAELHSYELPCVLVYPALDGLPGALAWIVAETRAAQVAGPGGG